MSVVEKENTMSDQAFEKVASIAMHDAGLAIPKSKKALVQSRIARRLRTLGLDAVGEYIAMLDDVAHSAERKELISILTTNVSSFYRERHHIDHLTGSVFADLKAKLSSGDTVRIWSAGCSSGQEPYTIAIELLKHFSSAEIENTLILATDIDPMILAKARRAQYPLSEMDPISETDQKDFFQRDGDAFVANNRLKSLVRFRELNLHADWPMQKTFDAIFCRNVLIYFDDAHQKALWPRFHKSLKSKGQLYLGHSERIHPVETSGFESIGATIYQKTT